MSQQTINYQQLAADLNAIKAATWQQVGTADAQYIRRLIRWQRGAEILGRITLMLGFFSLWWLLPGMLLLAWAKIVDNMEIGHNVLHGQYDWMNDPLINSQTYEWDIAADAGSWRRIHNHEHHTYTNIIGKDRDFGYGLLRMSDDLAWRPKNRWQFITYLNLSLLFEWGVAYHELAAERVFKGRKKANRTSALSDDALKRMFFSKAARQLFKDYVFFPLLAGPLFVPVLLANLGANLIRNLWTSTIIFCGHFTEDVQTFHADDCANESQGQWYHRQMLGSSNLTGSRWFHLMTGHLSCQIEHHLFPDIPARRYPAMAAQVEAVANKHGIPYNSGSFWTQYRAVLQRLWRYSWPDKAVKEPSQPSA
ncbi:fatty acid desaturase family protein [Marinicella meishanensis]|uniref:fatty acid desaturase family protein n=1 Tax=Marinicella meishanensis TaxID=2873263 RepID=UPI001CBB0600|nr:acyl-CoA desaturase [Marinicella sp. NBU2979]